jgi:hypothetical protein
MMQRAASDVGGPGSARGTGERDQKGAMPPAELQDSWFRWPKPAIPPPARPSAPPERLDDDVADAWFR